MKELFIKYNPYILETEITVDGRPLADNSPLRERSEKGSHLQEWVEDLPQMLLEEYNDREFMVTFHGTTPDYEDVTEVFTDAYKKGLLTATLDRIPAKETADKEKLIEEVFLEIQSEDCPFEELKSPDLTVAFEDAKNSDFKVCVVATMSAGKSTLINAMLGEKLMPSKGEACTAVITKIKDTDQDGFRADAYDTINDTDTKPIERYEKLTLDTMNRLNDQPNIALIDVFGNIPFVTSKDISLVLIDTPGRNNGRTEDHAVAQKGFLDNSSKALVLYIMTSEFGTTDDKSQLLDIAKSMAVGGKQSKDRFIFVINKMDGMKEEDGSVKERLNKVNEYLASIRTENAQEGILNPNLFPVAALPALSIRRLKNGANIPPLERIQTETFIKYFNYCGEGQLHLDDYAPLPPSVRKEIEEQLEQTRSEWKENNGAEYMNPEEALIHTGVVSVEAAIRQYVQKYAKTAKIKNIADTFVHKLEELDAFENTKKEIRENKEKRKEIGEKLRQAQEKIDSANEGKMFRSKLSTTLAHTEEEIDRIVNDVRGKSQKKVGPLQDKLNKHGDYTVSEALSEVSKMKLFIDQLETDYKYELNERIIPILQDTGTKLLISYKEKLVALQNELNLGSFGLSDINPLKLVSSKISLLENFSVSEHTKKKDVKVGEVWVENTDKKWYKPWTWFQEDGYYRAKYESMDYVPNSELLGILAPIQSALKTTADTAKEQAKERSHTIAASFNTQFDSIDTILKGKLKEFEDFTHEDKEADELIKESEKKLTWLNDIMKKIHSIMDI